MSGLKYEEPPKQQKISPYNVTEGEFLNILSENSGKQCHKTILDSFLSFSPLVAKEVVFRASNCSYRRNCFCCAFKLFHRTSVLCQVYAGACRSFWQIRVYPDMDRPLQYHQSVFAGSGLLSFVSRRWRAHYKKYDPLQITKTIIY